MSKAPEWIYLDGDVEAGDGMFPRCFENPKYASEPQVEYVRVDLAEAAEQQGYASAMEDARKLHEARIEELEAKLAKAVAGMMALTDVSTLMQSSSSHNRFRHNTTVTDSIWSQWSTQLKFARITLAELSSVSCANLKGVKDE